MRRIIASLLTLFGFLSSFNSPSTASIQLESSEDEKQLSALVKLDSEDRLVPRDLKEVKLEAPEKQSPPRSRPKNRVSIAEGVDPDALNLVGCWHCNAHQYNEAKQYFEPASEQGNLNATFNLGRLYKHGFGVEKNWVTAASLYQIVANKGSADAQNDLGVLYLEGRYGLPRDLNKAKGYFMLAEAQDLPRAKFNLGCVYYEMDKLEMAILYFEKAMSAGDSDTAANSQHNLGMARERLRELNAATSQENADQDKKRPEAKQDIKNRSRSAKSLPDLRSLEQLKQNEADDKPKSLQDTKRPKSSKRTLNNHSPSPPPSPKNGVIWTHLFGSKRGSQEPSPGSPQKGSPRNKSPRKELSRVVQPDPQDTVVSPLKRAGSADLR